MILVPEDLAGARRALAACVVALFLGVLVATLVADVGWPAEKPMAMGAELEREQKLEHQARFADGTLAARTERELRMTSRARKTIASPYALWLYRTLGYTHDEVIAGRQGWLFSEGRTALRYRNAALEQQIDTCVVVLDAAQQRLAAADVRLLVMPIPRKEVTCAEFLPRGLDAKAWVERRFIDGLRARGVEVVDLVEAWSKSTFAHPPYHVAGSHWTAEAELASAEAVARALGRYLEPAARNGNLHVRPGSAPEWDLLTMAGVDVWVARAAVDAGKRLTNYRVRGENSQRVIPAGELGQEAQSAIAVVGTSFTAERSFAELLSHLCNAPVVRQSELGGEPSRSLAGLHAACGGRLPCTVVFELPVHVLFSGLPFPGLDELYGRLAPPQQQHELAPLRVFEAERARLSALGRLPIPIAAVSPGTLVHDGSGRVWVRLRGRPGPEGVLVTVRAGEINRSYVWPATSQEFLAPLLSRGVDRGGCFVLVSAREASATLELSAADAVVLGGASTRSFPQCIARQSQGVWSASFARLAPALAPGETTLVLRAVQPDPKVESVEAALVARSGAAEVWRRGLTLRKGEAKLVLALNELLGRENVTLALECASHRLVAKSAEIVATPGD